MAYTLEDIAQKLKDSQKKVQLIYAFNGTGKTRLSKEFKKLVTSENEESEETKTKILYYNAFTEDLFSWDNEELKLLIKPNSFIQWILKDQGQDHNISTSFQKFSDSKIIPKFNEENIILPNGQASESKRFSNIEFLNSDDIEFSNNDDMNTNKIKISKGEESNFIWSIFYILIEEVISELNKPELEYDDTNPFHNLEYIFIDDPVSSLDENHLIELAVNLAYLIKINKSDVKFIITTHSPLFYNVLFNELNSKDIDLEYKPKIEKYKLMKKENSSYDLIERQNDSPFSYHLFLKQELENAASTKEINKYHFNYLRNILEKTASFYGQSRWSDLLPQSLDENGNNLYARIINHYSHSKLSSEEVNDIQESHKNLFIHLVQHLNKLYNPDLTDDTTGELTNESTN